MTLARILMAGLVLLAAHAETSLLAQTSGPPQSIDIRVDTEPDGPEFEDCSDEQEDGLDFRPDRGLSPQDRGGEPSL